MIVTTNKAAMISHSRVPLRLSGLMPKTTSIQSLCTKVITNRTLVAMATPVSSQKRHLNAFPKGSPCLSHSLVASYQNAPRNAAQKVLLNDVPHYSSRGQQRRGPYRIFGKKLLLHNKNEMRAVACAKRKVPSLIFSVLLKKQLLALLFSCTAHKYS